MGYDTLITSAWALFFGILGIMVYLTVRFEWTFAIGAVIALTHDVLLVLGLVILSGTELNVIHIGALLTVAGTPSMTKLSYLTASANSSASPTRMKALHKS